MSTFKDKSAWYIFTYVENKNSRHIFIFLHVLTAIPLMKYILIYLAQLSVKFYIEPDRLVCSRVRREKCQIWARLVGCCYVSTYVKLNSDSRKYQIIFIFSWFLLRQIEMTKRLTRSDTCISVGLNTDNCCDICKVKIEGRRTKKVCVPFWKIKIKKHTKSSAIIKK